MDRLQNREEKDVTNTCSCSNDDTTHGRRRNRTKRKFQCRIPLPARSSSSTSTTSANEGQQSDAGSSCSGQPLPITIEIKLCSSRSTSSNAPPVRDAQSKTTRRTMPPINEVEKKEFETWRQNRIHLRHSDDRLKVKDSQEQPTAQLPYRTQIRIEQRPKSPPGTMQTNTTTTNPEQTARFVQNANNLEPKNVSSTPQAPQFCQCSAGAQQFQQYTGQHFCRCQPPRICDNGIVWYAVCGNSYQRLGQQDTPPPTSTNIYVDVIPTGTETAPTVVRNEITPRSTRSVSQEVKSMAEAPIFRSSDYFDTKKSPKIKPEKEKSRLLLTITEKHKRDKSCVAVSRKPHQLKNENFNDHAPQSMEIAKCSKSFYKNTTDGGTSVEHNTIQRSPKLSSYKGDSQHRSESKERPKFSSKNEYTAPPVVARNYHQNCTLEDLPNTSRNKKVCKTEVATIKRSSNFYGQTNNRVPNNDNIRSNYSVASETLQNLNLSNESPSTVYSEAPGARSILINNRSEKNTQTNESVAASYKESSPSYYSVQVLSEKKNSPATVLPSILSKTSKYGNTQTGSNLKKQLPVTCGDRYAGHRLLPDKQDAGICTCPDSYTVIEMPSLEPEYGDKGNISSRSHASISPKAIQYDEKQSESSMKTQDRQASGSKQPKQCSLEILPEYREDLEERVNIKGQSGRYKLNSPAQNPANTTSTITTTNTELSSNEETPSKTPNELRLRGGQDVDFSLRKNTRSTMFSIKTRGDDFSLRFHNSNEETKFPLNESTNRSPDLIPNMNVVSEKPEKKARRSSVSLCRLKKHVNCACPSPAIVRSSSSDADDVQCGPPNHQIYH